MAAHKQRKLSSRGRSPAPESRQTDSAPIRATAPLTEQYYVAVDRQLKLYAASGVHVQDFYSITQLACR
jgi:hypothetical protein